LVLFSDRIIDSLGFDRSPNEILQRIAGLHQGKGQTALLDSLAYSIGLFPAPEPGDAIYLISDGGDNHSKLHEKDLERELLSRGIRLFSFMLSEGYFLTEDERAGVADVRRLAQATGGSIVSAWQDQSVKGGEQVNAQLRHAYDLMKRFYELGVELPPRLETEHRWELQILEGNGKRRRDLEVTYPRSLPLCSAVNLDKVSISK
jgi:hypothetical protein